MDSFDEADAALRRRIASGAARSKAAPPGPRRGASVMQATAASVMGKFAAHQDRVAVPNPAVGLARSLAEQTLSRQAELKGLKNQKRDLESQLYQALSLKSHKESEYKLISGSISNVTATNEKLNDSLMELSQKRDTWAAVISDQLQDLETREAKSDEDSTLLETLEAVSWFNKFLGWQVIGGKEGVKFVFDKINPQCPEKEYSLCIKIDNGTYNLVQCDPAIKDFEELVKDLNLTADLCKFLKVAREKFLTSSVNDVLPVPFSPPVTTTVNHTSGGVPSQSNSQSKKRLPAKRRGMAPSPASVRRSPRLLQGLYQRGN